MIYNDTVENLLREGLIRRCRIDEKSVLNLMKRAHKDIRTAQRNLAEDEDCAFSFAYNSMLHSGLALMASEGYRPEIKDKHLTIVSFAELTLDEMFNNILNDYDFIRRKRHRIIYEPGIPCSLEEAKHAIKTAAEFNEAVYAQIRKKRPQLEFRFK